jgi:hypothetical protein
VLREALLAITAGGTREAWLVDEACAGWPLDDPAVLDALGRWLRQGGRELHVVAADFEALARQHARFAEWRRDYTHALHAWQPLETQRGDFDAMLVCKEYAIEWLDRERWRARLSKDPAAVVAAMERVTSLLRRCQSAWPSTALGL